MQVPVNLAKFLAENIKSQIEAKSLKQEVKQKEKIAVK